MSSQKVSVWTRNYNEKVNGVCIEAASHTHKLHVQKHWKVCTTRQIKGAQNTLFSQNLWFLKIGPCIATQYEAANWTFLEQTDAQTRTVALATEAQADLDIWGHDFVHPSQIGHKHRCVKACLHTNMSERCLLGSADFCHTTKYNTYIRIKFVTSRGGNWINEGKG